MAHYITEDCIGCGLCAKNCPVAAIAGQSKQRHAVRASWCIDCGICGNVCPKAVVRDAVGNTLPRMKVAQRTKAEIDPQVCSGCRFCADICPLGCIGMDASEPFSRAVVMKDKCVGCRLCKTVCSKEAITFVQVSGLTVSPANVDSVVLVQDEPER